MRKFIYFTALFLLLNSCHSGDLVSIVVSKEATHIEQLAAEELKEKLQHIYPGKNMQINHEPIGAQNIYLGQVAHIPTDLSNTLSVPANEEAYLVKSWDDKNLIITSESEKGILYAVYNVLERLGYSFTLNEDIAPKSGEALVFSEWEIVNEPLAEERIIFNWHNFVSGCSGWNYQDWETWINQSQKMGFNTIMLHLYPNNPIFDFEFNGFEKKVGFLSSSNRGRDWSTEHVNDIRRLPGGDLFKRAVFGSEAALVPDDQRVKAIQEMMARVFAHAEHRGMHINLAYDFDLKYANPQEMVLSLPVEARFLVQNNGVDWMGPANAKEPIWLVRPDTPEGYRYYKAQVTKFLSLYPQIDKLILWKRVKDSPWSSIRKEELPVEWQQEFDAITNANPPVLKMIEAPASFAQAKLVHTYRQILNEIGASEVQLGFGTWRWYSTEAMNFFYPKEVRLYLLDSEIIRSDKHLHNLKLRQDLNTYINENRLVPLLWSHHDDGAQFGSSLKPYEDLMQKLSEIKTQSFGVFHWMTRPFDAWVINHGKQAWSNTKNQSFDETLETLAQKWFEGENVQLMADYMKVREKNMPHFGRETRRWFIDDVHYHQFDSVEVVIKGCQNRIEILKKVNVEAFDSSQKARYEYYLTFEKFVMAFYKQQGLFLSFEEAYERADFETAQTIAASYQTKNVLQNFSEMIKKGQITRGEKGLLFSLGLRWHPHFLSQQQRVGLHPIHINFSHTYHEPMAQMPGKLTYFIDEHNNYWKVLGERETGKKIHTIAKDENEINQESIQLDTKLKIPLTTYTYPTSVPKPIIAGDYLLHILIPKQQDAKNLHLTIGKNQYKAKNNTNGQATFSFSFDGKQIPYATISSKNEEDFVCGLILETQN